MNNNQFSLEKLLLAASLCVVFLFVVIGSRPQNLLAEHAGYALEFDGSDDHVTLGDTGDLFNSSNWESAKTISLWVKPGSNPPPVTNITSGELIAGSDRPRLFGIYRTIFNNQDQIWVWHIDSTSEAVIGIDYLPDEWMFITAVHDGTNLTVYKNGVEVGSVASGPTYVPNGTIDGNLFLAGNGRNNPDYHFSGQIDEVRFWKTALNPAQIIEWMNQEVNNAHPNWADLAAYYKMNDGSGLIASDSSGNGPNGSLVGDMDDSDWVPSTAFSEEGTPVPTTLPTSTSTPTPTNTPLPTDTPTATATETPTLSATFTPSATPTSTNTPLPTDTPTATATATETPTPSATFTPTSTPLPTDTPTATAVPFDLQEIGSLDTPGAAFDLVLDGDYAYIADSTGGLRIIDISDPAIPVEVGAYDTPGRAYGIDKVGSVIYLANNNHGLWLFDVSDVTNPTLISVFEYEVQTFFWDVSVHNNIAYASMRWGGLHILDVSDPANVFEISFVPATDQTLEAVYQDGLVYLADYQAGIRVVDVNDPANPSVISTFAAPSLTYGLSIVGDFLYLASGNAGLTILDVSNPAQIASVGSFRSDSLSRHTAVDGQVVYVADWQGGVMVLDISDQTMPSEIATIQTPDRAQGVVVREGLLYVADYASGLHIYTAVSQ